MIQPQLNEFEKAVQAHKEGIDQQIQATVELGLSNGTIKESQFEETSNGDMHYRLNDQQGTEIVYNVSQKRVHSYGGNLNQNVK